jgi:hypothetical protein
MNKLTEKRLLLAVIVAAGIIFLLNRNSPVPDTANVGEKGSSETVIANFSPERSQERVVYICRLESEEIPAVQISEVRADNDRPAETIARAAAGSGIEITTLETAPTWDFKSISARSGNNIIEVAYDPAGGRDGDDWILTLANDNIYFRERVRDCQEVSDE